MDRCLPSLVTDQILCRAWSEYLEMPGLRLTRKQAQRLWGLDEATCAQLLEFLVQIKFLRSDTDSYSRLVEGSEPGSHLRMARAQLRQQSHRAILKQR